MKPIVPFFLNEKKIQAQVNQTPCQQKYIWVMGAKFILTRTIVRSSSVPTESVIYQAKLITFKPVQRFNDVSEWRNLCLFWTISPYVSHLEISPETLNLVPRVLVRRAPPSNVGRRPFELWETLAIRLWTQLLVSRRLIFTGALSVLMAISSWSSFTDKRYGVSVGKQTNPCVLLK